jgi:hypothetical protein
MVHIGVLVVPVSCEDKQDDCENDDDEQDHLREEIRYAF